LIAAAVIASLEGESVSGLLDALTALGGSGNEVLANAIRRVLAGERDEDTLGEGLRSEGSLIIHLILRGIADPSSLVDAPTGGG
jgi:hypothetical protein